MHARLTAAAALTVLVAAMLTASYRLGAETAVGNDQLRVIADAYERVRSEAVQLPEERGLVGGAVQGILAALGDPYAAYYTPDEFTAFNRQLEGEFSGVGLYLEEKPDGLTVVNVIPETPAARGGVVVGERVVSVDGENVRGLPLRAVVRLVAGPEGTTVRLGLEGGPAGPRELELVREVFHVPNVESELLADGVGYVRILEFSEEVGEEVRGRVDDLLAQGARGIVLDLRGNPGGLLREAVDVAGVFIEDGLVVTVREREEQERRLTATGDAHESLPLVVLIDQGSASASEIVAAAVGDLDRGQLVGEKTFGKGTVQTVEVLPDGSGIKFTTAEYLTPSGASIEGVGVAPDEEVQGGAEQLAAAQRRLQALIAAGA